MGIPQSHDPSDILLVPASDGHGKNAEIACSVVAQGVGLFGDFKSRGFELGFHLAKDSAMTQGKPGAGSFRRGNVEGSLSADCFCSAMKKHAASGSLDPWLLILDDVHVLVCWF